MEQICIFFSTSSVPPVRCAPHAATMSCASCKSAAQNVGMADAFFDPISPAFCAASSASSSFFVNSASSSHWACEPSPFCPAVP